jgi:hypothetical protein
VVQAETALPAWLAVSAARAAREVPAAGSSGGEAPAGRQGPVAGEVAAPTAATAVPVVQEAWDISVSSVAPVVQVGRAAQRVSAVLAARLELAAQAAAEVSSVLAVRPEQVGSVARRV